jgi:hypothetical protein
MATGRFVITPDAMEAMPASAAVAVMRSLRTSEARQRRVTLPEESKSISSPSLHEAYSVNKSHFSLSLRRHSHGPPVCEMRDACRCQCPWEKRPGDGETRAYAH